MPKEETVELMHIRDAYIVKSGITTSMGHWTHNPAIYDTLNLTEADDYWYNMTVVIIDGANKGLARRIIASSQANSSLTVYPHFPTIPAIRTSYKILSNIIASGYLTAETVKDTTTLLNGTVEQTFAGCSQKINFYGRMDLSNLTQPTIIREYEEIDETNPRLLGQWIFPTDFPSNTTAIDYSHYCIDDCQWKITLQSMVAEGVDRTIARSQRIEWRN